MDARQDNGAGKRARDWVPYLIIVLWCVVAAGAIYIAANDQMMRAEHEFRLQSENIYDEFATQLTTARAILNGFAEFAAASGTEDHSLLRRYAAALLADNPGGYMLEVAEAVASDELPGFLERQREKHGPEFAIRIFDYQDARRWLLAPLGERHVPITFIEPRVPEALPVLGLDLGGVEPLRTLIRAADDPATIAVSPPIQLVEGSMGLLLARRIDRSPPGAPARAYALLVIKPLVLNRGDSDQLPLGTALTLRAHAPGEHTTPSGLLLRRWDLTTLKLQRSFTDRIAPLELTVTRTHSGAALDPTTLLVMSATALLGLAVVFAYARWHHAYHLEQMREERKLFRLANFDALTGLPNRNLLLDRLEQAALLAQRNQRKIALLFLDLDGFKAVNDRYGHHTGDEILRIAALRIRGAIRNSDTCARYGGDEFVVLLQGSSGEEEIERIRRSLRQNFAESIPAGGLDLQIGISIGTAVYPDDSCDLDELIHTADRRMYRDKAGHARDGEAASESTRVG